MTGRYDAIVIGAGVNGLTAGTRLARAGKRVLILEERESAGGQSRAWEFAPGFRVDPLAHDAGWLPPAVARGLGLPALESVVPDPAIAVPAGSGEWLALAPDTARAAEKIRRFSPSDAAKWPAFCARIAKLAGFLEAVYRSPPPDVGASGLAELLPLLDLGRRLKGLGRVDMIELLRTVPMSVQELLDDWFECAPLKAAVGGAGIADIRQGPRSGGTAFVLLHHQVGAAPGAVRGRAYWKAGPGSLADALTAAARQAGAEIRTGAPVARISIAGDRVTGVVLAGGEEIAAGCVLSSADPARTLLGLVDPVWLDPEFLLAVKNIKFRGISARVIYALEGIPELPGLADPERAMAGTLSFSGSLEAMERAADAAKYGRMSERPHVEAFLPSVRWAGLAPAGKHVLVARAQSAPYALREGAWDERTRAEFGDRVTSVIEAAAPGFGNRVRHREVLTPADLESRYGLTQGAVTHGEMTLDQILFMRPVAGAAHYAMPVGGLYLAGAGAHPGSGIAGAPGWLAAGRVLAD